MHRGSYKIQDGYRSSGVKSRGEAKGSGDGGVGGTRPVDTSFSTCLMALLFFMALCIVIMLAAWPWSRDKPKNSIQTDNGDRPEHFGYSGRRTTEGPLYGEKHSIKPKENHTEYHPSGTTSAPLPTSLHPTEKELPPHGTETTEGEYNYDDREPGHDRYGTTTRHPSKGSHPGPAEGGRAHPAKGGHRTTPTRLVQNHTGSDSEPYMTPRDDAEWVKDKNASEMSENNGNKHLPMVLESSSTSPAETNTYTVTISAEEENPIGDTFTSPPPRTSPPLLAILTPGPNSSVSSLTTSSTAAFTTFTLTTEQLLSFHQTPSTTATMTPLTDAKSSATSTGASEIKTDPPTDYLEVTGYNGTAYSSSSLPPSSTSTIPSYETYTDTAITTPRPRTVETVLSESNLQTALPTESLGATLLAEPKTADIVISSSQIQTATSTEAPGTTASNGTTSSSSSLPPSSTSTIPSYGTYTVTAITTPRPRTVETVLSESNLQTAPPTESLGATGSNGPTSTPSSLSPSFIATTLYHEASITTLLAETKTAAIVSSSSQIKTATSTEAPGTTASNGTTSSSSSLPPSSTSTVPSHETHPDTTITTLRLLTGETVLKRLELQTDPPTKSPGAAEPIESTTTSPSFSVSTVPDGVTSVTEVFLIDKDATTRAPDSTDKRTLEDDGKGEHESVGNGEVAPCETPTCRSISSRMLALMDHSAEPCEDFYAYACGGMRAEGSQWIAEEIPDLEPWLRIAGMMEEIDASSPVSLQKFKEFHHNCLYYEDISMDERIETARNILIGVGRLYYAHEEEPNVGNFTELLGNLLSYNFSPILDVLLDVDSNSTSKFALKLTTPVHKSPFGYAGRDGEEATLRGWPRDSCMKKATASPRDGTKEEDFDTRYDEYTNCNNDLSKYSEEVGVALQNLKLFGDMDYGNMTHYMKEIASTLEWELGVNMQGFLPTPAEKNKAILEKDFYEHTVLELQNKYSRVDWNALLSKLINNVVPEDTVIHVYFESYFEAIFKAMDYMEERKLNNALLAMFAHELYHGLVLNRNGCSRYDYCLAVSSHLMEDATSALFLRSFHPHQFSSFQFKISAVFHQLISKLESEVSSIPWLKGFSQAEAIEKVSKMKVIADGGVPVFLNYTYLDSQFEEFQLPSNATYLERAVSLLRRYRKKMYSSYGKNPSAPEQIWSHFTVPHSIHGMAVYGLNTIVVPYGVMLRPFLRDDSPSYIQMAGLGNLIAREVWHHFDKTGIMYGVDGSKDNLFTKDAMDSMEAVATCLEDQYASERTQKTDDGTTIFYKLKSFVSTNNRLSDIGAAHLAYASMWGDSPDGRKQAPLPWSSLPPKQLYFLALAQNHCTKASVYDFAVSIFEERNLPPFRRVNDIAYNSREFAEAFSCPSEHEEETPCQPFTLASAADVTFVHPEAS